MLRTLNLISYLVDWKVCINFFKELSYTVELFAKKAHKLLKQIMNNLRFEKEIVVKQIEENLNNSLCFFVAGYSGLNVAKLEKLRSKLKGEDAKIKVFKNRLLKIAALNLGYEEISKFLEGPNLFVFGSSESPSVAKTLHKFSQKNPALVLKGGIWEKEVVDAQEIVNIANTPSFEEAIARLSFGFVSPLQQLALSLKLLSEQIQEN